MSAPKVAVIGVGHMGQYHVGVYSELVNSNLIAVVDTDEGRLREISNKYGVKGYTDYGKIINKVDAVSIAVPTLSHYEIARDFLQAGVHVLVEKPITDKLADAEELFRLAEKKGLALHVGHVERFNGAVQDLKKIVEDPILIESRRLGPYSNRCEEDGVILDLMIHDLDIILNLVNSPVEKINAMGNSVFSDHEDVANVQIMFASGCLANVIASRSTQYKIRTMAITQRDSYVFLDYTDQDIRIHRQASSQHTLTREELRYTTASFIERVFVHKDNPLKLEIKHFLECAKMDPAARKLSPEEELYSLRVALEIKEMIQKGRSFPG